MAIFEGAGVALVTPFKEDVYKRQVSGRRRSDVPENRRSCG